MSKMIRVDSCENCEIRRSVYHEHCKVAALYVSAMFKEERPADLSKILPNCPLEDYPTTEREDTREG